MVDDSIGDCFILNPRKPLNCRLCLEKTQVISEKLLDFLSYKYHYMYFSFGQEINITEQRLLKCIGYKIVGPMNIWVKESNMRGIIDQ